MIATVHHWVRTQLFLSILLVFFGLGVVGSIFTVQKLRPPMISSLQLSYIPSGKYLKVASLGYREIIADLIWVRAIQLLGPFTQTTEGYLAAYRAADVLTDLSPRFVIAYQAVGTVLAVSGHRVQESAALLRKGVLHNPESWVLPFLLGYNYYFELQDPVAAAEYFRIASGLRGAPPYLSELATRMTVEAGDLSAAKEFLQRMHSQTNDQKIRDGLVVRMQEVEAEIHLRTIERAIQAYRLQQGGNPSTLDDLVRSRVIQDIPQSPDGKSYSYDPITGQVSSSTMKQRFGVHRK